MTYANPFGCRRPGVVQPKLDDVWVQRTVSTEVDKETLLVTPVFEMIDSVKEIQSCKDLCGLDYMKKLLASGQVSAEDLQDNANAEFDTTVLPGNVHEAKRMANQTNEQIAQAIKAAGGQEGQVYNAAQIEALISDAVKAAFAKAQANTPKEGDQQ